LSPAESTVIVLT